MSILIKGMKMPKYCGKCELYGEYGCAIIGAVGYALTEHKRPDDCPLVELPPHGRLIDVDAFEADRRKNYCEDCKRRKGKKNGKWTFVYEIGGVACLPCGIEDVLDDLEDAPTIIEAEGEG